MSRKPVLLALFVIIALIMSTAAQPNVTSAQGGGNAVDDTPPVWIEVTGVVASIDADWLTLTNGTAFKINGGTKPISEGLVPGETVIVIAEVEDERLVAKSIVRVTEVTPEPTVEPTAEPTAAPTANPTAEPTVEALAEPTAEPTVEVGCGNSNQQPVALRLSEAFGVSYAEIMNWHCKGYGFGEIARAYELARLTADSDSPLTVEQLFAMRAKGEGWGQIIKASGIGPSKLAPGQVIKLEVKNRNQNQEKEKEKNQGNQNPQGNDNKGNSKDKSNNGNGKDKSNNGKGNGKKGN